jgi:hypothetical protein
MPSGAAKAAKEAKLDPQFAEKHKGREKMRFSDKNPCVSPVLPIGLCGFSPGRSGPDIQKCSFKNKTYIFVGKIRPAVQTNGRPHHLFQFTRRASSFSAPGSSF